MAPARGVDDADPMLDPASRSDANTNASGEDVFSAFRLGPLTLRNRFVKCGTHEGMSRDGRVTDALIAWHRAFAEGGVAMTTLAYCSVAADGRTFSDQIWMQDDALPGLRRFTEAIHAAGALAAIQLGHAGWFATPEVIGGRPLGPSRTFSPRGLCFSRAARSSDLDRLERDFVNAARRAVDAGFDGIELHVGHGYLLSQFLSPYNNRRRDAWGGPLEHRARFPRRVLRAVRDAVGGRAAIWAKLNMEDGFSGGMTLDEGVQIARWIEEDASVDALQLTGGHTTRSAFFLMRGDIPLAGLIENEPTAAGRLALRVLGRRLVRPFPFSEAFFSSSARRVRDAVRLPLMLLGGITKLETMQAAVAEGFPLIALGRALICDPDLVNRMRKGELQASRCVPCNRCVVEMERGGTRCVMPGR